MGYLLTQMFLYMLAAFLLGLLLGWIIWGRRHIAIQAELDAAQADLDAARRERDALRAEFDAARADVENALRGRGALQAEIDALRAQLEACANARRALERQISMTNAAPPPPPPPVARVIDTPVAPPPPAPPRRVIDDLKKISGIGRVNEGKLNELGITSFAQIAAWSPADEARIGDILAFEGRIEREEWVRQAKILARGGDTEFSQRVERGEVDTSK
jgi:predicted flap endonuclease-1-like 5' DNA nuclease